MIPEASGSKPHAALQIDALSNGNLKSLNETRLTVDVWVSPMENRRHEWQTNHPLTFLPRFIHTRWIFYFLRSLTL